MKLAISDPGGFALKNALRAAIVAPAAFALSLEVVGLTEMALFAGFGSMALMVFVDFGGDRLRRLAAYLALVGFGALFIAVGTLCSRATGLAVAGMAVVAFAILFAGVFNGYVAAAQPAATLTYVLAAMVPAAPSQVPTRLAGWGLAAALSLAAIFGLWPRRPRDRSRDAAAAATGALAELLEACAAGEGRRRDGPAAERRAELSAAACQAVVAAHAGYVALPHRPSGIGGRTAALGRLIDDLEWLDPLAREQPAPLGAGAAFGPQCRAVETAVPAALRAAERRLREDDPGDGGAELAALAEAHEAIGTAFLDDVAADGGERGAAELTAELDEAFRLRGLAYAALQVGRHAIQATGGTAPPDPSLTPRAGRLRATRRLASSHASMRSVWLRNSLRGAAGLALAVLVARLTDAQNGFWVVLGTMSVLRSTALATGRTVVEAVAGTVAGIVLGGLIVVAIGGDTGLLWATLPLAIGLAAYSPRAVSFAAGQAGFTIAVVILFNLLNPVGWSVGVVRIEDIAIGSAISLAVGLLLWPRGAAAVLRDALGGAYVLAARYLDAAISSRLGVPGAEGAHDAAVAASEAALRLDETVREYLGEHSSARRELDALARLVGGATRVRRVARLVQTATTLAPLAPIEADDARVAEVRGPLDAEWDGRRSWFEGFGEAIAAGAEPPPAEPGAPPLAAGATSRLARSLGPPVVLGGDSHGGVPPGLAAAWAERHLESLLALEPALSAAARSVLSPPRERAPEIDHP